MPRLNKPTKKMQLKVLQDKLDQFGEALYYINDYMQQYGLTKHYQGYLKARAEETELPQQLMMQNENTNQNK